MERYEKEMCDANELDIADEQRHYHRQKADIIFLHALLACARLNWNVDDFVTRVSLPVVLKLFEVLAVWTGVFDSNSTLQDMVDVTFAPANLDQFVGVAANAQLFVTYLFARGRHSPDASANATDCQQPIPIRRCESRRSIEGRRRACDGEGLLGSCVHLLSSVAPSGTALRRLPRISRRQAGQGSIEGVRC